VLAVPREKFHILTKSSPKSADEAKRMVSEQLKALQVDKIDFYGWHGINIPAEKSLACASGGPVEALLRLKEEGVIGNVGFSTHGAPGFIKGLLDTELFQFVNFHYYYFDQSRASIVDNAAERDMGVLIISPNDKGGHLFNPPKLLSDITAPLTPIQWNARFCLSRPGIHTLAFGMTEVSHFKELEGLFPLSIPLSDEDEMIKQNLDGHRSEDPHTWFDGRKMVDDPSGINIPEVLRQRMLWKCYNMEAFADYRYNMFDQGGTWFPGDFATRRNVNKINYAKVPEGVPLKKMLLEFHRRFYRPHDHFKRKVVKWLKSTKLVPLAWRAYKRLAGERS
jgi:predicted aldo/keto reductase-like oxidoreductase